MKIKEGQLYSAINEYIEKEIMPIGATLNMTEQFMFYFKVGVAKRKIEFIVKDAILKNKTSAYGLIDADGYIDIDTLYQSASDAMSQMKQIEIGGITFRDADLQKLYGIIHKYAT